MENLNELLDNIKMRPGMYLGESSLTKLEMFLRGYIYARRSISPLSPQEEWIRDFSIWVAEKFEIKISKSWADIILFFSQDEHEAFDRFFLLVQEFREKEI